MKLKQLKDVKGSLTVFTVICLYFFPLFAFGQENGLESQIQSWQITAARIAKAVVGLAAIGGGIIVYFKMNVDEGERGKKALLTFIGALLFAVLMFYLIDFFLGTNIGDQVN